MSWSILIIKKSLVRNSENDANNAEEVFHLSWTCYDKILKVTISFSTAATAQDPAK